MARTSTYGVGSISFSLSMTPGNAYPPMVTYRRISTGRGSSRPSFAPDSGQECYRMSASRAMCHSADYDTSDRVRTAPTPRRGSYEGDMPKNLIWIRDVLSGGAFIDPETINWVPTDTEEIQLRDKLHTYLGITPADRAPRALVDSRAMCIILGITRGTRILGRSSKMAR